MGTARQPQDSNSGTPAASPHPPLTPAPPCQRLLSSPGLASHLRFVSTVGTHRPQALLCASPWSLGQAEAGAGKAGATSRSPGTADGKAGPSRPGGARYGFRSGRGEQWAQSGRGPGGNELSDGGGRGADTCQVGARRTAIVSNRRPPGGNGASQAEQFWQPPLPPRCRHASAVTPGEGAAGSTLWELLGAGGKARLCVQRHRGGPGS